MRVNGAPALSVATDQKIPVLSNTCRAARHAHKPAAVQSSLAVRQESPDFVKTLEDLVRDHGATFRGRATFRQGAECFHERMLATPDFELWLLSWLPGQVTPIHDHGGAFNVITVLAGNLLEERYTLVDHGRVRPIWTMVRGPGDLDTLEATAIHRVRPLGTAVSLHLCAPVCLEGQTFLSVA